MNEPASRTVVSVVTDLLTSTRISSTGAHLGIDVLPVRPAEALEACRRGRVDLVVIDLESDPDAVQVVRALKQDPIARTIPVLAFFPHVRKALGESAKAAGAERVLPRSAFARRMGHWLSGELDTPA